ncbi:MAG: glycosyltransferase [Bacteroidetes bacterium]|nr:glycosyltransferase [Bacteroidota bacterium]
MSNKSKGGGSVLPLLGLPAGNSPLVSCIMPTYNRRSFVAKAIEYFLRQDYPNKELVVVDDGTDSVEDLVPSSGMIRYVRLDSKKSVGAKRNIACEHSRGEIIAHWDDDDWHAPHRLTYQLESLRQRNADVCGIRDMLFYDISTGDSWIYQYPRRSRFWLAGGSLVYRKEFWRRSPFPDAQVGEDSRFVWSHNSDRALCLPDYRFYVALIHPGNTSPKRTKGSYWSRWSGDMRSIVGSDFASFTSAGTNREHVGASMSDVPGQPPVYSLLMVTHNALQMVKISTLRTLRHSASSDARLVVVDNDSHDGTREWLSVLAERGDITLICNSRNVGHGRALEQASRSTASPYLVTLDSDAFPQRDDWLLQLRKKLDEGAKIAGIRHHRDYIHPSCLMVERATLEEMHGSFLDEKDQPSLLDVAERISVEAKHRGFRIAGLERTQARRRGSVSEPVYLGSSYEGLVYHQWYTTRAVISNGRRVDDVPDNAIRDSLTELIDDYEKEPIELTVVLGVRANRSEKQRLRNARACLRSLNLQDLERWRYRVVVVEQDSKEQLREEVASLADRYLFAHNGSAYNRGWAFNIGAVHAHGINGVLCCIDADLVLPRDFLKRCLQELAQGSRAVQPFTEIAYLNEAETIRAIRDLSVSSKQAVRAEAYGGQVFTTSQGGCMVVEAALYHEIGGHDERFRGWGYEDREFWGRLSRATKIAVLPGRLLHLNHPRSAMADVWAKENHKLGDRLAGGERSVHLAGGIGDLNRYSHKATDVPATSEPAKLGQRSWENWHRWSKERVNRILLDEENRRLEKSARRVLAHIVASLGDQVLDLGCGPGAMWRHLEAYKPRLTWAGVDITPEMVAVAQSRFPSVPVYQADAAQTPLASKSFDVVLIRHMLEHLPVDTFNGVIREAMRLARRAIAIDFSIPLTRTGERKTTTVGEGFLETQWTVGDVEAAFLRSGWHVEYRLNITSDPAEQNEVWIMVPDPNGAGGAIPVGLKLSIVMPTYRRQHTIIRTIRQIQAQTYRNWELIIIDNSGDGGYFFNDPRIKVVPNAQRASASLARNKGLELATGDLICYFDDDDDMFPTYLARFVDTFEGHAGAKMVRCGMEASGRPNFTFATPECCLRRNYATPTWEDGGSAQDQRYFTRIVRSNGWTEAGGDIVVLQEVLCRANADRQGGLRSGFL